ncbi:hypothetical protein RB195_025224 [Necator americanus]|uniref:Reverse transcriptase domain-containing protein n=1 Tax=Necator americanus TaxID=51031 RepID=A0ABR1ERD7_NECAM
MSRSIEVSREYHLPLVLTFVDYEKAFDSVETDAVLSALADQCEDTSYVRALADCYDRCTTKMQLFHRPSSYLFLSDVTWRYYIAEAVHDCITMDNGIISTDLPH